jgi:hypothetical protein
MKGTMTEQEWDDMLSMHYYGKISTKREKTELAVVEKCCEVIAKLLLGGFLLWWFGGNRSRYGR